MLASIKAYLLRSPDEKKSAGADDLQVAVVALLIRAATADAKFGPEERATIRRLTAGHFDLSSAEISSLVSAAEGEEAETLDLYRWTQAIKAAYSEEERIGLIEKMWEVVYADGVLDDYEANLLRRVAGLIYVPDRESGEARRRVMNRLGISSGTR
tara:strand:+ start:790 stop:1257 length:468 start_codon:yes stop_codon:yes gene_type:complete